MNLPNIRQFFQINSYKGKNGKYFSIHRFFSDHFYILVINKFCCLLIRFTSAKEMKYKASETKTLRLI